MSKIWTVYKHTAPNGKCYIGCTCKEPKSRWGHGNNYNTQPFYEAIKEFGWDNIKHEILYQTEDEEEGLNKEIEYIALYKSADPKYGYNRKTGGRYGGGYHMPEEFRKKISLVTRGRKLTDKQKEVLRKWQKEHPENIKRAMQASAEARRGTHRSEETKRKISETLHNGASFWIGKHHSDETKQKLHECNFGENSARARRVARYTLDNEYIDERGCIADYARELNLINGSSISACCKGKRSQAHGYKWRYVDDTKE